MAGIPPALETDAEDVAWALQTAEALWRRNERVDAIVWLRRAAQSAGEAEDDDRALVLARDAAELAEWMAQNPAAREVASGVPDPTASAQAMSSQAIDDLLFVSEPEPGEVVEIDEDVRLVEIPVEPAPPESERTEARPPPVPPPLPQTPPLPPPLPVPVPAAPAVPPASQETEAVVEPTHEGDRASFVPTAAEKHAGMLDPWAETEAPTRSREGDRSTAAAAASSFEPDEVVTSAPAVVGPSPRKPAPSPRTAAAPAPAPMLVPAPALPLLTPPASARAIPPSRQPSARPTMGVDLSDVDALSDLPDDARAAFARAATVQDLARNEEIAGFALALLLEGSVDVSATIVDVPVRRLARGAVLRARGTIAQVSPIRVVGAADSSRVATWDEQAVDQAFRTCPWVEDDLRAAGDRIQAEVGLTMGPLGERLDPILLSDVTGKLTLRVLAEHEVYAIRGKLIPGLMVVGAGELELVGDGDELRAILHGGEFLFPAEVLSHAPAPATARAGKGGALVLFAERAAAQELLVTCPPLLEIFAGG